MNEIPNNPNILWIMTDQQSADMMSCAGNTWLQTPNMDFLADNGVRFANTWCGNPVCLPSRYGMITGTYPGDSKIKNNYDYQTIPPQTILDNGIGKLMTDAGYEALHGGKEHYAGVDSEGLGFKRLTFDDREALADDCSQFIRRRSRAKPFFLTASFINPHDICYYGLDIYAEASGHPLFKTIHKDCSAVINHIRELTKTFSESSSPPLPENYHVPAGEAEAIGMYLQEEVYLDMIREGFTEETWRLHRQAYHRLTEVVDRQIGVVIDALKETDQFDNTVILFTSDHGEMGGSHRIDQKGYLYEECCRVPMIVKGLPGDKSNICNKSLVNNALDSIPTILDYAGIRKPDHLPGLSLKQCVSKNEMLDRDYCIVESQNGVSATDGQYKYARYVRGGNAEQFYDFSVNPGEMYNQIGEVQYSERLTYLRNAVDRHIAERPVFNNYYREQCNASEGFR